MNKNFLKFTAITLLSITSSFIACENNHKNKTNENEINSVQGLNAQPQQEISPAPPIDSSANLKNNNNPAIPGMNAQPQQEIAPGTALDESN